MTLGFNECTKTRGDVKWLYKDDYLAGHKRKTSDQSKFGPYGPMEILRPSLNNVFPWTA